MRTEIIGTDATIALFVLSATVTVSRLFIRVRKQQWWWDDTLAALGVLSMSLFLTGMYSARSKFYITDLAVIQVFPSSLMVRFESCSQSKSSIISYAQ